MDDIYFLIGELICDFQQIESLLALLVYYHTLSSVHNTNISVDKALISFYHTDKKTLGKKLETIEKLAVFENENDLSVLKFLNEKRNYIVHSFFIDTPFASETDIESDKKELYEILANAKIIKSALTTFVYDYQNQTVV